MRALAYAAIFGVGLMAAGVATADTWTDPAGRFTVSLPHVDGHSHEGGDRSAVRSTQHDAGAGSPAPAS